MWVAHLGPNWAPHAIVHWDRPIAIASVVSKLFEHLILFKLKPLLTTSDNQFGFKPLHGTDMCTFLLKEVVRSYTTKNTPVYSVFVDASKAFDRVNHVMLFHKLKARSVRGCLLRLLHFWYTNQTMMIKWGNWNDRRSRRVFLCFYSAIF